MTDAVNKFLYDVFGYKGVKKFLDIGTCLLRESS